MLQKIKVPHHNLEKIRKNLAKTKTKSNENTLNKNHKMVQTSKYNSRKSHVNLTMNGLPVLDQSPYGTCATFATTAAIDAQFKLYQKSPDAQISQLCLLELSRDIADDELFGLSEPMNNKKLYNDQDILDNGVGFWDGANGWQVLKEINRFGYLDLYYQQHESCGGVYDYPNYVEATDDPYFEPEIPGEAINPVNLPDNQINPHHHIDFTRNNWNRIQSLPLQETGTVNKVKRELKEGNHILFGP